jgi:hypothetical protein
MSTLGPCLDEVSSLEFLFSSSPLSQHGNKFIKVLYELLTHSAYVNRSIRSAQAFEGVTASLQRFVHRLQEQTLLRVDCFGLVGADVEKRRVEHAHIFIQQVRVANIGSSVSGTVVVVKARCAEPVRGNFSAQITRAFKQLPQGRRGIGAPWKSATATHDSDGL